MDQRFLLTGDWNPEVGVHEEPTGFSRSSHAGIVVIYFQESQRAYFAATFKTYSGFSARRFISDLNAAHEQGFLAHAICHNSVLKALENPALTPVLTEMIRVSSLPLAKVETKFAADSSGFCTSRFTRFFDFKYGVARETADWVKCHVMIGVKTNVITAVEILDKHAAATRQLPKWQESVGSATAPHNWAEPGIITKKT